MTAYFVRRLLLVPITFIGITFMVYAILSKAPGNPLAAEIKQAQGVNSGQNESSQQSEAFAISPVQMALMQERYQMDKGMLEGYAAWLGLWPREMKRTSATFGVGQTETQIAVFGTARMAKIRHRKGQLTQVVFADTGEPLPKHWQVRIESPQELGNRWRKGLDAPNSLETPENTPYRAVVFERRFSGLFQGDFGRSSKYNIPVWDMMVRTLPISLLFGISSIFLTYLICLPLGVFKALKHGSSLDSLSSVLVFSGYAIPGYALGALLVVWAGARMQWFPYHGLTSVDFEQMNWFEQVLDIIHHAFLPLVCYVVGSFAMLTMLVKNSLLDQLGYDYIRTAVAKGVSYRRAVVGHALRNALIPVATNFGGILGVFVAGNYLVEKIFDINGFGLLSFRALQERDYFVVMGVTAVTALLVLLGNIISDMCVAAVDPRVSFE